MLQVMRDQKKSLVIWLFLGMIIVVFVVFFGPQAQGCDPSTVGGSTFAAAVNGQAITENEFNFAYRNRFQTMQSQNPAFDIEAAREMDLRQEVMDDLVEQELLAQEAVNWGIRVTDEELVETISDLPYFQREGKFDPELYRKIINYYFQTSVPTFEEMQRQTMLAARMQDVMRHGVQVADEEVEREFINRNDKLNLEFVRVDPVRFKDGIEVSDEDAKKWGEENGEKIEEEYASKKWKYKKKEERKARHILIKVAKDAAAADADAALAKIKKIEAEIKDGKDFAEAAKAYSEGPTNVKGGDLGFFGKGVMDKAFEAATWQLKAGEMSAPVRSSFGYHLIKLEEIQEPGEKTLDEVRDELAKELAVLDQAKVKAKAEAEKLQKQLAGGAAIADLIPAEPALPEGKTLTDLTPEERTAYEDEKKKANPYGLRLEETGSFARSSAGYVPRLGLNKDIHAAVFNLTEEKPVPEELLEDKDRFFLVRVKERAPAELDALEDAKDSIADQIRATKGAAAVKAWLKEAKERASIKMNASILDYGDTTGGGAG